MRRKLSRVVLPIAAFACTFSLHTRCVLADAGDSYIGAEIQSPSNEVLTEGETYLFEWVGRPAPGETAITLFSLYDQSSPWSEITFETFGGGANGSSSLFQTQYITDGGNQHLVYHSSPDIFDGAFHTFGIVYRPSSNNESAYIEWLIDGETIRTQQGGDANDLDNTMRVHAAVWKVYDGGWGSFGNTELADRTAAAVKSIEKSVESQGRWDSESYWTFTSESSLNPWTLSSWSFSSFDGSYDDDNAKIINDRLHLVLSREGYSESSCTITDGVDYAFENVKSGKFLDVRNYGTRDGSLLQQWGNSVTGNHRVFTAVEMSSGYWAFENVGAGRFLDVEGGVTALSGSRSLQLWGTQASPTNRQFRLVEGDHGGCELRPRHALEAGETKCIGVQGAGTNNGRSVVQFDCNTSADQEWNFIPQ